MKSVLWHGCLAALGLATAYQTWTREVAEETLPGAVTIIDCESAGLESLTLKTKQRTISAQKKSTGRGDVFYLINIITESQQKAGKVSGIVAGDTQHHDQAVSFVANAEFENALRSFTPLKALRELGKTTAAQQKTFELNRAETELELRCGQRSHRLLIGASTYGEGDRYALKPGSDRVYLVKGSIINDLVGAQNGYMQRELHAFGLDAVGTITVRARGTSKRLMQRNRGSESATWVDAAHPEQRNKVYANWLTQLSHLSAAVYLPWDKEPGSDLAGAAGSIEPVLTAEYELEKKPLGKLELVRVEAAKESYYYAKSEKTRSWVTVARSVAEQISQDLSLLLGVEQGKVAK
jgi:hypothetical protein